jgi:DNA-binding NarL/FixJ family response regulator
MMIKLILVDDDVLIRESLKIILEMDDQFQIVGTGENGKEAISLVEENDVDVAILDIRMPVMNGVEATEVIAKKTKVLILTTFDEDDLIQEAFNNGASGYLLKNSPPDQIKQAILSVYSGNAVMTDAVLSQLRHPLTRDEKLEGLTNRERDVVQLIAKGLTNAEIASNLFISEGTVKNTVSNILSKLELKHRTQIAVFYLT